MRIEERVKEQYQNNILSLASTIHSYSKQYDALMELVRYFPDEFELGNYDVIEYATYAKVIEIRIPYNMDRADQILKQFVEIGWSERKEPEKSGTSATFYYQYDRYNNDPIKLDLSMCARTWDYPGQSCKLVQVGVEQVERPVYEVRCPDPA